MTSLLIALFIILLGLVACASTVNHRGRVRLRFGPQPFDHSAFTSPCNALM
jgi:aspartyl/asparaginyl beta-hydroxylase (cupin superfamily)